MPHIHTKPGQHDLTTSGYIVRIDGPEPRLLLHLHKKLKIYLPPGGHVELHETPTQAVAHEILEEVGYELEQLQLLQPTARLSRLTGVKLHPIPAVTMTHQFEDGAIEGHFHTDISYVFVTGEEPKHNPVEGESMDLRLFTREELKMGDERLMPPDVAEAGIFIMDICLKNWERLPAETLFS